MSNKISVIIDVAVDKANAGIRGFKQSIADADGTVGKFKAGAASAFDSLKANAGNLAMAGGAALVAFGVKAVGAFQDLALEAGKLSDALGMPVEDASRLIEVAGDVGVEVSSLESTIGRMNRTAGQSPQMFDDIGASIARNRDGTMDVNQTFLNVVDALNKIPDAGERAKRAQDIFGRSWMNIAELVGQGSDQIKKSMADVSDAKVIDEDEVRKARDFRAALDTLNDAMEDVVLIAGEGLVPVITDLAEALDLARDAASNLGGVIPSQLTTAVGVLTGQVQRSLMPWKYYTDFFGQAEETSGKLGTTLGGTTETISKATDAVEDHATETTHLADVYSAMEAGVHKANDALEAQAQAADDARESQRKLADQTFALHDAEDQLAEAVQSSRDQLANSETTMREARQGLDDVAIAADGLVQQQRGLDEASLKTKAGLDSWVDGMVAVASEMDGPQRQAIVDYISAVSGIPAGVVTTVVANTEEAQAAIDELKRRNATMNMTILAKGGIGFGGGVNGGPRALGGPTYAGAFHEVFDTDKPELLVEDGKTYLLPAKDGRVTPLSPSSSSQQVVNFMPNATIRNDVDMNAVFGHLNMMLASGA